MNWPASKRRRPPRSSIAKASRALKGGPGIDASGYDAGKKIKGKKRHAVVDTLGLMVGLAVSPGDIQDRDMIAPLLKVAREMFPSLARAIADGGYQGATTAQNVREQANIPLEIVKRSDTAKGFVVLPKRWIPAFARTSRTFGWLGRCRRLAKDFENLSRSHRTAPDLPEAPTLERVEP